MARREDVVGHGSNHPVSMESGPAPPADSLSCTGWCARNEGGMYVGGQSWEVAVLRPVQGFMQRSFLPAWVGRQLCNYARQIWVGKSAYKAESNAPCWLSRPADFGVGGVVSGRLG
jgi:hypothetical protein